MSLYCLVTAERKVKKGNPSLNYKQWTLLVRWGQSASHIKTGLIDSLFSSQEDLQGVLVDRADIKIKQLNCQRNVSISKMNKSFTARQCLCVRGGECVPAKRHKSANIQFKYTQTHSRIYTCTYFHAQRNSQTQECMSTHGHTTREGCVFFLWMREMLNQSKCARTCTNIM